MINAFENRRYLIISKGTAPDYATSATELLSILDNFSDDEVITIEKDSLPSQVYVSNSHEYRDLIQISLNLLYEKGCIEISEMHILLEKTLQHEHEHSVPALDQPGVEIRFAVDFFEDTESGEMGFRPFINLSGDIQVSILRDVILAVSDSSPTDAISGRQRNV